MTPKFSIITLAFIFVLIHVTVQKPQQSTSVSINNNALFTLGTLAAVGGTAFLLGAYHNGQKGSRGQRGFGGLFGSPGYGYYSQPQYYQQPQYYPSYNSYDHGYHFGRKRRAALHPSEDVSMVAGDLLTKAFSMDKDHCGLSLVCELGTKSRNELPLHALTLKMLLGEDSSLKIIRATTTSNSNTLAALSAYQAALVQGKEGKDCSAEYKECPTSSHDLYEAFANINVIGDSQTI